MARIKIKDLSKTKKISREDMKVILGGSEPLEITDEMGFKLQIAMERRSKIISTMSEILKKISQTEESIIENLK